MTPAPALPSTDRSDQDHAADALAAEVAAYREARWRRLTSPTGWLNIIAKTWLTEGVHSVGGGPGADIPLPPGSAPPILGRLTVRDGVVTFDADPRVPVFAAGTPVKSLVLRPDTDESPNTLTSGSLTLQLIRRGTDLALRVRDLSDSRVAAFPDIPAFPVDPRWRIVARLQRFAEERQLAYADNEGRAQTYVSPGLALFQQDGMACALTPVFDSDRRRLFVLFSDATNADETYGAGRFLYAAVPAADDDALVLDFNKSFNPPCAFTDFAACPLPPPDNRLSLRVRAGEKRPR